MGEIPCSPDGISSYLSLPFKRIVQFFQHREILTLHFQNLGQELIFKMSKDCLWSLAGGLSSSLTFMEFESMLALECRGTSAPHFSALYCLNAPAVLLTTHMKLGLLQRTNVIVHKMIWQNSGSIVLQNLKIVYMIGNKRKMGQKPNRSTKSLFMQNIKKI
jgi:hypothetical protein